MARDRSDSGRRESQDAGEADEMNPPALLGVLGEARLVDAHAHYRAPPRLYQTPIHGEGLMADVTDHQA